MRQTALSTVYDLAKVDPRVVFIGSDLGKNTLEKFKEEFPERFFMEGVSEAHIIGMAAGLALEGKIPYFNTITTFISRRAYEQVVIDLCLHNLPVRLLGSGGGLVYAPLGPTHLAIEDIALMRAIPQMTVVAPADAQEMRKLMLASLDYPGPIYVRIAKGGDPIVTKEEGEFVFGKAYQYQEGKDALIITTGICLKLALDAAAELKTKNINVSILHCPTIKPLDIKTIMPLISQINTIVSIEEGIINGGLGSAIAELIAEASFSTSKKFKRLGIPDTFCKNYGSQEALMKSYNITTEAIVDFILKQ